MRAPAGPVRPAAAPAAAAAALFAAALAFGQTHPSGPAPAPAQALHLFAAATALSGLLAGPEAALRDWLAWMGRIVGGGLLAALALLSAVPGAEGAVLLLLPGLGAAGAVALLAARSERAARWTAVVAGLLCAGRVIDQAFGLTGRPLAPVDALVPALALALALALYASHGGPPEAPGGRPADGAGRPRLAAPAGRPALARPKAAPGRRGPALLAGAALLLLTAEGLYKLRHALAAEPGAQAAAAGLAVCALAGGWTAAAALRFGGGWRRAVSRRRFPWEWLYLAALVGVAAPLR